MKRNKIKKFINIPNAIYLAVFVSLSVSASILLYHSGYMKTNAAGDVSFNNANSWVFQFSQGVPAKPSASGSGGWYFDIPVMNGDESVNCKSGSKTCPSVNMLITPYKTAITAQNIVMNAQVTTTGTPKFNYKLGDPSNTCTTPASARFYLERIDNNYYDDFQRWWSNPVSFQLKAGGLTTISVPLKPDQWSSVLGARGSDNANATNGFKATLSNPKAIGLTFGGGCFFGHGVNVSGGTARFTVTDFKLTSGTPPSYSVNSVVGSASAKPKIASNSWATVYGQNLISDASCGIPSSPSTNLCGTIVKINGQPVTMSFASKYQVNFLVPNVTGNVNFELSSRDGSGGSVSINVLRETMDLYSQNSSGSGLVSAQHWTTPGIPQGTLVSSTNPARSNYPLVIYASGLGNYGTMSSKPTIKINNRDLPASYISYVGLSNGQYQINLSGLSLSSLGITTSGTYSIQLCGGGVCGNTLQIPVKQ